MRTCDCIQLSISLLTRLIQIKTCCKMLNFRFPRLSAVFNILGMLPFTYDEEKEYFVIYPKFIIFAWVSFFAQLLFAFNSLRLYLSMNVKQDLMFYLYRSDAILWVCIITAFFIHRTSRRHSFVKICNLLLSLERNCWIYSFNRLDRQFWTNITKISFTVVPYFTILVTLNTISWYTLTGDYIFCTCFDVSVWAMVYFNLLTEVSYFYRVKLHFSLLNKKFLKPILFDKEKLEILKLFFQCWNILEKLGQLFSLVKFFQILFGMLLLTQYSFYLYFNLVYPNIYIARVWIIPNTFFWMFKLIAMQVTIFFWKDSLSEVSSILYFFNTFTFHCS